MRHRIVLGDVAAGGADNHRNLAFVIKTMSGGTSRRFQFLLMETSSQLWQIIREYISIVEDRGMDAEKLLSFLFELSFHGTGQAYNVNTLTKMQLKVVEELVVLGLV